MLININDIFICIGIPKPCLRLNSLAAGAPSVVDKERYGFGGNLFRPNSCQYLVSVFIYVSIFSH